jgi:hypothetical protein
MTRQYKPIEVAVALLLYGYNVSPLVRAEKLYEHFEGRCAEVMDILDILMNSPTSVATELAMPTALVYVNHALEKYGEEATRRVRVNLGGFDP